MIGSAASIIVFNNLLIASAQPEQLTTNQSLTQQQEEKVTTRQGIVTSSIDPLPGHEGQQMATVLPFRQDGSTYSGVLTFTATEPVEVAILNMGTFNETEQATLDATPEDSEFGTLLTQLDNQTSIAVSYITPPYGDSPSPSASILFAGNAVWLHTSDGTPFAASYTVSAEVLPSDIENSINITTETTDTDTVTPEDDGVDAAEDTGAADIGETDTENTTATDIEGGTEEEAEGATGATTTTTSDEGTDEVAVRIPEGASELTEDAYTPNPVEVNVGGTVTWINDDSAAHTATSGSSSSGSTGVFGGTDDSPEIIGPEGDTQSFTFNEAGEFEYYCTLHPNMVGTVVVRE
ncbi:MAG: plastocyanin/azurin family copper-binding protein [Nitrososphaera sp.]